MCMDSARWVSYPLHRRISWKCIRTLNEQFQVLDYVRKGKTFMTAKGFNITDPYHQGGFLHTRTHTKFNSQLIHSLLRQK